MATPMIDRVAEPTPATSQELTYKDRQGIAMGWVFSALGAAVIFNVGFGGGLIGMALMELVIVGVIVVVNAYILRPAH
jgi:hypothetical protein